MQSITIKNAALVDCLFEVVRQPSGTQSAILLYTPPGAVYRTEAAKIEISAKTINGKTTPVATVAVPYGVTSDGVFKKLGQVNHVLSATQPADCPSTARFDAEAFARNILANTQIQALFKNGTI